MSDNLDAVILAGGLGTRLRSVVSDTPKCLVPVNNLPFLTYKIQQLKAGGIRRVILCVGYMADQIEQYFTENPIPEVSVVYAHEHDLLGTAGAFKNAEPYVESEHFIALNGDVYLDLDYRALISQHTRTEAIATLALARVDDPSRFGLVVYNTDFEIEAFLEKQEVPPDNPSPSGAFYINAGTYCFHRSILERIPAGKPCSIERDIFPTLIDQGFFAYPLDSYFIDIGTPESFAQIQDDIQAGRLKVAF
jgi:mannose-1-phosphate guanylyltransferase